MNLRPAYFMENILGQLDTIKQYGIISSALKGDLNFPMVATKDIAVVGAQLLLNLSFKGNQIQYVLGPRDLTYNEVAHIVGDAIGKHDFKVCTISSEDSKKAMTQSGFASENVAELYNMMSESMKQWQSFKCT